MSVVCAKRGRLALVVTAFIFGFSVVAARLYYLQVLAADEIAGNAIDARKRIIELPGKRGEIYDRDRNLLAGTRSMIEVGIDPHAYKAEDGSKLAVLAGVLDLSFDELSEKVNRKFRVGSDGENRAVRWLPLAKVPENVYGAVSKIGVSGVYGNRYYERYYAGNETAAHLIGFVNNEFTPVMGLERAYDFYLEGQKGWMESYVDGRRQELAAYRDREVNPREGYNVISTIDLYIQSLLEKEIEKLVETYDPEGVCAIISDPRTGEILALANYPTFNPNNFNKYPIGNLRNRAVTDVYEPGSTFKIVPVSGALEDGVINPFTVIDCSLQKVDFHGRQVKLPNDHKDLGKIQIEELVAKSSNRGAAQVGMMLGEDRMYNWAKKFGFGAKGTWPLEGEISGILHDVQNWDGLTISRLPTGYAIGATPLQVHNAMSTIASGGVYRDPRLIREVIDSSGKTLIKFDSEVGGHRVISKDTADIVSSMLTKVVSVSGTARRAELPGFEVAGKTGTSRKIIDGVYSERNHYASFSGFFPASDPRVVITVMVDDAKSEGPAYGGIIAAPLFKAIGQDLISHLAIKKPDNLETLYVSK